MDHDLLLALAGMAPSTSTPPLHVTIIGDNPETLAGLHGYLARAGVASNATRTFSGASPLPPSTTSVVIFPDEFGVDDVVANIRSMRATRPQLLVVLVTSTPQNFRSTLDPNDSSPPLIVLSKPTFGWILLSAIRPHTHSELA